MVVHSADASRRRYITEEIKRIGKGNISADVFTFLELSAATKNFNPDNLLGEGGFGSVYKGQLEKKSQVLLQYTSFFFHFFLSTNKESM